MTCKTCGAENARNSKYCLTHKRAANETMRAMFAKSREIRDSRNARFAQIWDEATLAGNIAVKAEMGKLVPMIVEQHANMLNDRSTVVKSWLVAGGSCGYSTVRVTDGTCSFAKWAVKNELGSKSYYRGISLRTRPQLDGPLVQSYQLNRAFASAFAEVLHDNDIPVTVDSRED